MDKLTNAAKNLPGVVQTGLKAAGAAALSNDAVRAASEAAGVTAPTLSPDAAAIVQALEEVRDAVRMVARQLRGGDNP